MSETLRAAVVGLGSMGRHHTRVWGEIEGVELVGVSDADDETVGSITRGRSLRGFLNYEAMFDELKPKLVSVVVPTNFHEEVAIAAMERGIAVLIEKPLGPDTASARRIIECAERTGVVATVGHIERFNPAVLELERRLKSAPLGRIFQIKSRRTGPMAARIRDVGVTIDLATHDIDIIRQVVGEPIIRVYAETAQRIHSLREDLFTGLFRFANDVVGLLDINWLTPTKIRELSVAGERGMFVVDYLTQDLTFYENSSADPQFDALAKVAGVSEGNMVRYAINRVEPLRAEIECFVAAVRGERPVGVSLADGLAAVRMAELALESAAKGQAIDVGEADLAAQIPAKAD
ncbi:MAG: Gfo/Idh/MocA family oxidoreductase [Actinobacteria bacterium]|nr:Gfo/Idh/MocA family oxidoreductase [Actinomycetota bacterium]